MEKQEGTGVSLNPEDAEHRASLNPKDAVYTGYRLGHVTEEVEVTQEEWEAAERWEQEVEAMLRDKWASAVTFKAGEWEEVKRELKRARERAPGPTGGRS